MATYLQMPPEMGGTRFGPFPPGIIQIGSDGSRCQIVLAANQGVFPVHAMLSDMGNGQFTLSPTRQGLGLFLVQAGESKAWPINGAVQAKHGDIIVVGSEGGPRFTIQVENPAPGAALGIRGPAGAGDSGAGAASAGSAFGGRLAQEAARQMRSRLIARNPYARTAYQLYTRFRFGSLTSPYFIISALGTIGAALLAGVVSCSGLAAAALHYVMR